MRIRLDHLRLVGTLSRPATTIYQQRRATPDQYLASLEGWIDLVLVAAKLRRAATCIIRLDARHAHLVIWDFRPGPGSRLDPRMIEPDAPAWTAADVEPLFAAAL